MKILFAQSQYSVPADFKRRYAAEIKKAYAKAAKLLPFGSKYINFFVQPREYSLMKTGDSAQTHNAEFIELAFDPTRDEKGLEVILNGVRESVYHEMNHAARYNLGIYHVKFLDMCVMEGLGTVFARDCAGVDASWAKYPKNVTDWIQEIIDKNDAFAWAQYSYNHPDGRQWVAYKVGTYIVDQAIKKSGKSVIELTRMECADILKLAEIDVTNYHGLQ